MDERGFCDENQEHVRMSAQSLLKQVAAIDLPFSQEQ
jgi:hypothetical protein